MSKQTEALYADLLSDVDDAAVLFILRRMLWMVNEETGTHAHARTRDWWAEQTGRSVRSVDRARARLRQHPDIVVLEAGRRTPPSYIFSRHLTVPVTAPVADNSDIQGRQQGRQVGRHTRAFLALKEGSDPIERLAGEVHDRRREAVPNGRWDMPGIRKALRAGQAAGMGPDRLRLVALSAAQDPWARTPGVIPAPGFRQAVTSQPTYVEPVLERASVQPLTAEELSLLPPTVRARALRTALVEVVR